MKTTFFYASPTRLSLTLNVVQGAILNVDFQCARTTDSGTTVGSTFTGNGVLRADGSSNIDPAVGTSSGGWDGITFSSPNTPSPASGLLNSSGNPTSATLTLTNWAFQDNCPNCGALRSNNTLLEDYIGVLNPAWNALPTMTIGGLASNSLYNLYIYGTNGGSTAGGSWSVNGSAIQSTTGNNAGVFPKYSNGNDYTAFSVLSDVTGHLVVTGTAGPNGNGYVILNGFQLSPSPAPEPSSVILAGLGAIGLLIAARCRRKA